MMFGWNSGMGWGLGGGLFSILIIIGVIVGIVFLVRWLVNKNEPSRGSSVGYGSTQSAEEILKSRYAKGEISREEFNKIRDDLR